MTLEAWASPKGAGQRFEGCIGFICRQTNL